MAKRYTHCARGFTLIEMAIVLAIMGLIAVMLLKLTGGMLDAQKRQTVRSQLNAVDTALANFVAVNKRLPCPADGRLANGAANAGIEIVSAGPPASAIGTCNPANQAFGVVPWVTLGLSHNEASDPWSGRFTYRVDPALASSATLPLLMDMSACDPSATGGTNAGRCQTPAVNCTGSAACTTPLAFLQNKGLDVWDGQNGAAGWNVRQNNRVNGTGAAYVIISHGPLGIGAYNANGIYQTGAHIPGTDEIPNLNNTALVVPQDQTTGFRDAPLNDTTVAPVNPPLPPVKGLHFDDYLSHPTIISVLNKANLGPRSH